MFANIEDIAKENDITPYKHAGHRARSKFGAFKQIGQ